MSDYVSSNLLFHKVFKFIKFNTFISLIVLSTPLHSSPHPNQLPQLLENRSRHQLDVVGRLFLRVVRGQSHCFVYEN
jgi:hypothetical protein